MYSAAHPLKGLAHFKRRQKFNDFKKIFICGTFTLIFNYKRAIFLKILIHGTFQSDVYYNFSNNLISSTRQFLVRQNSLNLSNFSQTHYLKFQVIFSLSSTRHYWSDKIVLIFLLLVAVVVIYCNKKKKIK